MIEKVVTEQMLTDGRIRIAPTDAVALGLRQHSDTIAAEFATEPFHVNWASAAGFLHGDLLLERLQDHCQIGGRLRIRRVGDSLMIETVATSTSTIREPYRTPRAEPAPSVPKKPKPRPRRRSAERAFRADRDFEWSTDKRVGLATAGRTALESALTSGGFDSKTLVDLRMRGERLATLDGFEELLAVDVANVDRMAHQEAVARHVLTKMRGRAVLADEVGLGKTIEAGLVAKELHLRGLARSMLVISPATLREQWKNEMEEKFELPCEVVASSSEIGKQDHLIMSLNLAARNSASLTARSWDLVIIDEAHRATGSGAVKTRSMIESLSRNARYMLFLTATPVQNDLLELYRLVDMLRPGTLGSTREFSQKFVGGRDKREPRDPADLRRLVSSAMIRTTRAQAGVDRVQRRTKDIPVSLGNPEQELYLLATDLLRSVMTDKADTMRRRHLASRLAGSPYSMGTTALRMAASHSDVRVQRVLNEIGQRAMDLKTSARENKAVDLTKQWLDEHGRVLMFTQHTDTVQALLKRFDREGIPAVPFHGSMAQGERAKSVQSFKNGAAKVLISTDAGAEGQNLQFCNCVVNYDLPWNPMRIEQRIGRVDRLTQPRDEVFVANMFAKNTIDEQVYRLLHDKLRMFELLFGQVTTILGELDTTKDATFESRVMEALFSSSDARMQGILDELGTDLERARAKGEAMVSADQGLSSWLSTAHSHRDGLTTKGAEELMPQRSAEAERKRQAEVQKWVRKVVTSTGGKIVHDTKQTEGAFISARFPEEMEEELGGRLELHLAFDRRGLEEHPLAELCAVGSPAFADLLGLLRERGDVHVAIPVWSDDVQPPTPPHDGSVIERTSWKLVHSDEWSGRAIFRLEVGATELAESILDVTITSDAPASMPLTSLSSGDDVPAPLKKPKRLLDRLEKAASDQARALRAKAERELAVVVAEEKARLLQRYDQKIIEAAPGSAEFKELAKVRDQEAKRLSKDLDVRARLELLALDVREHDLLVEETWTHRSSGNTLKTKRSWGDSLAVPSALTGERVARLSMCSRGHAIDASERASCRSCDDDVCGACGPDGALLPCPLCGIATCGSCRASNHGMCRACGRPERLPGSDRPGALAWQCRGGILLHVAPSSVAVVSPGRDEVHAFAREIEDTPRRRHAAAVAIAAGLPASTGVRLIELTIPDVAHPLDEQIVAVNASSVGAFTVGTGGGESIDERAMRYLPAAGATKVGGEDDLGLSDLTAYLRGQAAPAGLPSLDVTLTPTRGEFGVDQSGLFGRTVTIDDAGLRNESELVRAPWRLMEPGEALQSGVLAEAALGGLRASLHRLNNAIRLHVAHGSKDFDFVAAPGWSSVESQLAWYEYLREARALGGCIGILDTPEPTGDDFLRSSQATLTRRVAKQAWRPIDSPSSRARLALTSDLDVVSTARPSRSPAWKPLNSGLADQLLRLTADGPTHVLELRTDVLDTWLHRGERRIAYQASAGRRPEVALDDGSGTANDFGVCSHGHLHTASVEHQCASCDEWLCTACDPTGPLHVCACKRDVCAACLGRSHLAIVPTRCDSCGTSSCTECGADPEFTACQLCARTMCMSCVDEGDRCMACAHLVVASSDECAALPKQLAADGAAVAIGRDGDVLVALIASPLRRELAVLRGGFVEVWRTFVADFDADSSQLALGLGASTKGQMRVTFDRSPAPEPPADMLTLVGSQSWRAAMHLGTGDLTPVGAPLTSPADSPISTIATALGFSHWPLPEPAAEPPTMPWPDIAGVQVTTVECVNLEVNERTGITAQGISTWSTVGPVASMTSVDWGTVDEEHDDASWSPAAHLVQRAESGEIEATIARYGLTVALAVRHGFHRTWFSIHDDPAAGDSALLQERLGLDKPVSAVSQATTPSGLSTTVVRKASLISRVIEPVAHASASIGAGRVSATRLDWFPDHELRRPLLEALPSSLTAALQERFPKPDSCAISIGANVREVWLNASGRSTEISYSLAAGTQMGFATDAVTGEPLPLATLDRDGHLVAEPNTCVYCKTELCSLCTDPLVTCACCGQQLCTRCLASNELRLCQACDSLRRPSRVFLLKLGHWSKNTDLYSGADDHHAVVLERKADEWVARRISTGLPSIEHSPDPALLAQLVSHLRAKDPN
jgi:superfamily II DNA or RNA helicase